MSENAAESKELKPKSFRISTETHDKFREIASEIGGNQELALERLIQAYELEQSKTILSQKAESIEIFEQYANKLVSLYVDSLEHQQNQAVLIREEFKRDLKSKDEIIIKLQAEIKELKLMEEVASESGMELESENKQLKKSIEQMENQYQSNLANIQQMLAEKERLNKALTESCNNLKEKVGQLEALQEQLAEMDNLKGQLSDLKTQFDRKELEHQRELVQIQQKHDKELVTLRKKNIGEIEHYQTLYKELLEQQREVDKLMSASKKQG